MNAAMNRFYPLVGPALILSALTWAHPAFAGGTSAGTVVSNTASATYDESGTPRTVQSNTVTLLVDELLDVTATTLGSGTATVTSSATALPFHIANTGNSDETFALAATSAVAGNGFDATVEGIVIDSNANGVYDAGVDQILATGAATPSLAADGGLTVFVLVSLPVATADGATGEVRLTASAATGSGTPGTAFAGSGTGGGDAVVGLSTATANALAPVVARSAAVTLSKSAAIVDPFGTQRIVPGTVITYSLLAQVAGTGSVPGLRITDAIPSGTSYRPGTLTLDGAAVTDAADGDAGQASASGVDVALATIAAGTSRTVTFKVTIN